MAHGYLGDGFGTHGEIDPDSDERDWRERGTMFRSRDDRRERGYASSGDYPEGRRRFSARPEDHYRTWRERHMSELDRDYREYCREREQQFHRDFDDWRRQKYGNPQPLRTAMTQSGMSHDPTGMTQAAEDSAPATPAGSDPVATATLGTNSSSGGRRDRR